MTGFLEYFISDIKNVLLIVVNPELVSFVFA